MPLYKNLFVKLQYLLFSPRKFFTDSIKGKMFRTKDLVYLGLITIVLFAILHLTESQLSPEKDWPQFLAYLLGFLIGWALLYAFRTYFISSVLKRTGTENDIKQIGMVVGISMIINVFLFLVPLVLKSSTYHQYIEIGVYVWNLVLIIVGMMTLTKVKLVRAIVIVILMFGLETLFKYTISGIHI